MTVTYGATYPYTLTVTNNRSASQTVGAVTVSELLPPELTYQGIANAGTCVFSTSATPGASGPATLTFTNTEEIGPGGICELVIDVQLKNDPSLCLDGIVYNTAQVIAGGDMDQSSWLTEFACRSDLQIVKTGPSTLVPGGPNVTYALRATNNGPDPVCGITIHERPENFDPVWTANSWLTVSPTSTLNLTQAYLSSADLSAYLNGCLTAGQWAQLNAVLYIPPNPRTNPTLGVRNCSTVQAETAYRVTNTGVFESPYPPPYSCVPITIRPAATLRVTKTALFNPVYAGGIALYNIEIANDGPSDLISPTATIVLTDVLSGPGSLWSVSNGACSVDSATQITCQGLQLDAGARMNLMVAALVDGNAANESIITNTATVEGVGFTASATDDATVDVVNTNTSLAITKTVVAGAYYAGNGVDYTIEVKNSGVYTAYDVEVTDLISAPILAPPCWR